MMRRLACLFLFCSVVWLFAGCKKKTGNAPPTAPVKGTVSLDGRPMAGGEVRFAAQGQPPKVLEVKDGSFSGQVFTGKNQIEVVWEKDGPPHPMDPSIRLKVNAVAPQYSGPSSALNADIPTGGSENLKFDVTSR